MKTFKNVTELIKSIEDFKHVPDEQKEHAISVARLAYTFGRIDEHDEVKNPLI